MEEKKYIIMDSSGMLSGPYTTSEVNNEIKLNKEIGFGGEYKVYELRLREIHTLEVKVAHHIDTFE